MYRCEARRRRKTWRNTTRLAAMPASVAARYWAFSSGLMLNSLCQKPKSTTR